MQTVITLAVHLQILLQSLILLRVRQVNLLCVQIEQRVHFHELHSVSVVHVQSRSQFPRHVSILRSFHAPVRFVQDQNISCLQRGQLRLDDFPLLRTGPIIGL